MAKVLNKEVGNFLIVKVLVIAVKQFQLEV